MGSHIVVHLVKAKHNQILLHPSSVLSNFKIECFYCKGQVSKVVFRLGIISSKSGKGAIILCREPCLHAFEDGEEEWDTETWTPIIFEKSLLSGIVQVPTDVMVKRSRPMTNKEITMLENMWKKNPKALIQDLKPSKTNKNEEEKKGDQYVDIYFKKLGLEKKCKVKEAGKS